MEDFTSDREKDDTPPPGSRSPIALPEGTRLREEYRVQEVLGTGSFGITYRAYDEHLATSVAIKEYYPRHLAGRTGGSMTVQPYSSADTDNFAFGLDRFMQEGRTLARLNHSNIVDVYSYFEAHGTGYLVMDYYEGQTLADYLAEQGGRLPESEAVGLIRDVLEGLHAVHEEGILHRDIDPQNIYRTTEGKVVLIDFGAAREAMGARSQSLSVILKPGYAPYEQYYADGNQGPWTDVYACAATLYECLTGIKPPEAPRRREKDELVAPRSIQSDISTETSVAVRKGLAIRPEQRPASAAAFSALLDSNASPDEHTEPAGPSTQAPTRTEDEAPTPESSTAAASGATASSWPRSPADSPWASANESSPGLAAGTLGVALVGVLGSALLFGDESAVEILAYFGTWMAVSVGLIALFREGEKVMSPEARATVSDWLSQNDFVERSSSWPETFVSLFDAVFTERHFSWVCFRRSAVASIITVSVLLLGLAGVGVVSLDRVSSLFGRSETAYLRGLLGVLVFMVAFNTVVDYVSLFETRWVLGRMARSESSLAYVAYLGLDLLLTGLVFFLPFVLVLGILTALDSVLSLEVALSTIVKRTAAYVASGLVGVIRGEGNPMLVMVYSTLFTSVWVWLYAVAGGLLRLTYPLLHSLDWLKRSFDVEARPVHTMGVLLAVLLSVVFAVSAPLVL